MTDAPTIGEVRARAEGVREGLELVAQLHEAVAASCLALAKQANRNTLRKKAEELAGIHTRNAAAIRALMEEVMGEVGRPQDATTS
jgi:hypothetical protein